MRRLPNPRLAGLRVSMLVHLYRVRLRSHGVQELLAGSGIAVGVALVLGVLVADTSLTASAGEVSRRLGGHDTLQLSARAPEGFDARLLVRARRIAGVRSAGAVLRETVALRSPRGRASVQLFGLSPGVIALAQQLPRGRFLRGLVLPAKVAGELGVSAGSAVAVLARGGLRPARVGAVLAGGALAASPVAIAPLALAQRLTGLARRATQLLLSPRPRASPRVRASLLALAGGRLDVTTADNELRLLAQAVGPNDESTSLFVAISVMVGFLLSLDAMLLTVPERRRFVAELRLQGYDRRQILALLGFQALVVGLVASAGGVLLGIALSHLFLSGTPVYLSAAFPVGAQEHVGAATVLIALGCGVLATALASLSPALELRHPHPAGAVRRAGAGGGEVVSQRVSRRLAVAGAVSLSAITIVVVAAPQLTIPAGVLLAVAMLGLIPLLFAAVERLLRTLAERLRSSALIVVVSELGARSVRAGALAGIAALAVYGCVAIGGARSDLIHGLDVNFDEYLQTADLWVTTGGNDLTTNSFAAPGAAAAVARVSQVASVRVYQGGFLDIGRRRMWVIARPPQDHPLLPASQLLAGGRAHAEALLRGGGWAAVSRGFADERRLRLGRAFTLPTPSGPQRPRLAAVVTNLGWAPGAVIVSAHDYGRWWRTSAPSALEVTLRPGAGAGAARAAVAAAVAPWPGLSVQTLAAREAQYAGDSRQGLRALGEISTLLLISAALAVAAALSAALWQRRARLAALKIHGYASTQLWRAILLESAVVLGVGCAAGAAMGVYGHALATRWLRITTGFPAPFELGLQRVFLTLMLLATIAVAVISLPGMAAARVPPRAGMQE